MDEQLAFIRSVVGPLGYVWISSIAAPLWSMEVEYKVDNDKLKFSVRDQPTLSAAIAEMHEKLARIASSLPEYDQRKQIEHHFTPDLPTPPILDDGIPF